MISHVLAASKVPVARVLAASKVSDVESGDKLKHMKQKTRRLKNKKLAKSQNHPSQENQKAKNWKNRQKVGIHLILIL